MTNPIALGIFFSVVLAIGIDWMVFGTEHFLFLAKKGLELLEWLAFWR